MKVLDKLFAKKHMARIASLEYEVEKLRKQLSHLSTECGLQRVLIGSLRDVNKSLDERLIAQEGTR
jgi:hypothetical protein